MDTFSEVDGPSNSVISSFSLCRFIDAFPPPFIRSQWQIRQEKHSIAPFWLFRNSNRLSGWPVALCIVLICMENHWGRILCLACLCVPSTTGRSLGPPGAIATAVVNIHSLRTDIIPGCMTLNKLLMQLEEGKTAESVADGCGARWLKILARLDLFSGGEDLRHPGGHHFCTRFFIFYCRDHYFHRCISTYNISSFSAQQRPRLFGSSAWQCLEMATVGRAEVWRQGWSTEIAASIPIGQARRAWCCSPHSPFLSHGAKWMVWGSWHHLCSRSTKHTHHFIYGAARICW